MEGPNRRALRRVDGIDARMLVLAEGVFKGCLGVV